MIYFDMVRIWGNVPLVIKSAGDITSETIEEVYPAYFPPQTDALTIYKQIEQDLLEGIQFAPDNNPSDKTLFSKSVARALLAKVYAENLCVITTKSSLMPINWLQTDFHWLMITASCLM